MTNDTPPPTLDVTTLAARIEWLEKLFKFDDDVAMITAPNDPVTGGKCILEVASFDAMNAELRASQEEIARLKARVNWLEDLFYFDDDDTLRTAPNDPVTANMCIMRRETYEASIVERRQLRAELARLRESASEEATRTEIANAVADIPERWGVVDLIELLAKRGLRITRAPASTETSTP